ncbi:unnamed protein product [Thlaspi arvense]|uniref:F-box domain-containing protein n=1 Tax=Thlaspi arvense TaxID=13288 RepID=A0AAU9T0X0_THLAR|nr:unnamed protein product [Thlaspi arvense]
MAIAAKKVETCGGESINSLPDEVLGQILSFVPTKIAASASVLSKRWRNLLPLAQNLDFDESANRGSTASGRGFLDFVERTLVSMGDSPIKTVSLRGISYIDDSRYNHLVGNVLGRGILELHLASSCIRYIEPEFFFSKTLVKLTLSDGYNDQNKPFPGGVLFPALKSLSLIRVWFDDFLYGDDLYECLLSSPLLEEFNICDDDPLQSGCLKRVRSSSIQRISLFHRCHDREACSWVLFETPNLVYLDYSGHVAENYVVELDSLVEARLDLVLWKHNDSVPPLYDSTTWGDAWGADKLIAAISNVVTLHLSADSLEVFYCCSTSMPEFNNLAKLSFESHKERHWQVLPLLLENAPNLETLVIKGLVHKITKECGDVCVCERVTKKRKKQSCLLSCQVKVLQIYEYGGSCRELKQMRHFMENLRCLEVVKVKLQVDMQDNSSLTNKLQKLFHTASSKCKIQFI